MSRHANPRTPLWNPAQIAPEPPALILKIDDEETTRQIGDVRRWDGSAWATAEPTDARTDTMGVVVVVNADSYLLALWGLTWIDPLELTLDPHTDYWLDVGGVLTTTKPASAGILILRHYENGFVVVRSGSGGVSALDDLDDVDAATPDDKQTIAWDAASSKWLPLDAADLAGGNKVKGDATDPVPGYLADKIDGATIEHDGVTYRLRIKDGGVTPAKLANLAANSVLGRSAGTAGVPGAITATADTVLMMRSGLIGFYKINGDNIGTGAIDGTKLAARTITFAEIALGTITDAEISATAAIGWDKIDKIGAVPSDVGAQPESANLDSLSAATSLGWVRHSAAGSYAIYTTIPWGDIDTKPTTLAGYGITDACSSSDARLSDARTPTAHGHTLAGDVTGTTAAAVVEKWRGATVAAAVGSVSGASRADLVTWWDKTNQVWTTFSLNNASAVTGWINCYDTAATDVQGKMTGVMAGTACSVFGRSANTNGLPACIAAAADGTILGRASGALSFLYDVTLGNATNAGKFTVRSTALADAIVIDTTLVTTSGKKLSVREIDVCDAGVTKKMLVLASAPY
jgi:hypothetical protein